MYEVKILVRTQEEATDVLAHVEEGHSEKKYELLGALNVKELSNRELLEELGFSFRK